jgi:hypothetical protein
MKKFTIPLLLSMLLISGTWLRAEVHPVRLDPNTDPAKCLECHEDKRKGQRVHSAVAMGPPVTTRTWKRPIWLPAISLCAMARPDNCASPATSRAIAS